MSSRQKKKRLATYEHEGGSIVAAATRDSNGNLWFGSFFQGATVKMAGGGRFPQGFARSA